MLCSSQLLRIKCVLCVHTFNMKCRDFAADWIGVDGASIQAAVAAAYFSDQ